MNQNEDHAASIYQTGSTVDEEQQLNKTLRRWLGQGASSDGRSDSSDGTAPPDLASLHIGGNASNVETPPLAPESSEPRTIVDQARPEERSIDDVESTADTLIEPLSRHALSDAAQAEEPVTVRNPPPQREPTGKPLPVGDDPGLDLAVPQDSFTGRSDQPIAETDATLLDAVVTDAPSPSPPIIDPPEQAETAIPKPDAVDDQGTTGEDGTALFDVLANDTDGETLHLTGAAVVAGQGTVRIVDGQLHYDPGTAYDHLAEGEEAEVGISYEVLNDAGGTDKATLDLTITGRNDAPVVRQALSDQVAQEDDAFSFVIPDTAFGDPDAHDVLTYNATLDDGSPLPDWLHFDADTRTITGTPDNDRVGDLRIKITATDDHGAEVSDSFTLSVANTNDAPDDLTFQGGRVAENATLGTVVATAAALDDDVGDRLSYSLVDDADGRFAIDSETGEVTVADPAKLDFETASSHGIEVLVTDQQGASYQESLTIEVADAVETLVGTSGNDSLTGGAGADNISGQGGKDTLIGADGDDVIDGGSSHDTLYGNAGDDTLIGGTASTDSSGGKNSAIGGNDTLYGGTGDDTLLGGDGADSLYGAADDDLLDGGTGSDRLDGGSGIDTATYEQSIQAVTVNLATGTGTGGDAQGDILQSIENVTGSAYGDTITGNTHANTLSGGEGDDVLDGGGGNDVLYGGDGNDTLTGGSSSGGKNTVIGGHDELHGGAGADALFGGADDDVLDGGIGDDVLDGGAGADSIDGGDGVDQASYALSDEAVQVDLGSGVNSGGFAEGDRLENIENLEGSAHDDTLTGDSGANVLSGGGGDDVLTGGAGDDTLHGGAGDDVMDGGDGADHFVLMIAQGNDVVAGGEGAWTDVIELQDGSGGAQLGDYGTDWTVVVESGAIEDSGTTAGPHGGANGWLDLAEDTSGTIIMQDGTEIAFDGIEHITW